jgi:hypothetical protein
MGRGDGMNDVKLPILKPGELTKALEKLEFSGQGGDVGSETFYDISSNLSLLRTYRQLAKCFPRIRHFSFAPPTATPIHLFLLPQFSSCFRTNVPFLIFTIGNAQFCIEKS